MDIAEKRNKSYAKKKRVEKSIFITIRGWGGGGGGGGETLPPLPLNELTFWMTPFLDVLIISLAQIVSKINIWVFFDEFVINSEIFHKALCRICLLK